MKTSTKFTKKPTKVAIFSHEKSQIVPAAEDRMHSCGNKRTQLIFNDNVVHEELLEKA